MKLPQLSLRELFLLVVIAALGCGWWVDRRAVVAATATDTATRWKVMLDLERDAADARLKEAALYKEQAEARYSRMYVELKRLQGKTP